MPQNGIGDFWMNGLQIEELWNHWLWVMVVGRICYCLVVGMNMGERFLVRMLNSFSRGSL